MSMGTLPHALDLRKAAQRGLRIEAQLAPSELPRLRALLAGDEGTIRTLITCARDEQQRPVVEVGVEASLSVRCERCLQPFPSTVRSKSVLAVVWSDDQARALPAELEPLVAAEAVDLREVIEDELVLAMPMFSYHDDTACVERLEAGPALDAVFGEEAQVAQTEPRKNPFAVLAGLRRSPQDPAGE